MTQTFSASITRTELSLADLDLSASPYSVLADSLDEGTNLWRRDIATSPWVEGSVETHAVRDLGAGRITILVTGTDAADLETNIATLTAAFEQATYTLTVSIGNGSQSFICYEADWTEGWTWERRNVLNCPVTFMFDRTFIASGAAPSGPTTPTSSAGNLTTRKMVVTGGRDNSFVHDDTWTYAVDVNGWTSGLALMPGGSHRQKGSASFEDIHYQRLGGTNDTQTFAAYDIDLDSWSYKANTTYKVKTAGVCPNFTERKILSCGGVNSSSNSTSGAEEYDIDGNTWSTISSMPRGLQGHGAWWYGPTNRYYITAGSTGSITNITSLYDRGLNVWSDSPANFPLSTWKFGTGTVGNKFYAVGGSADLDMNYEFDVELDSWTQKANLPYSRANAYGGAAGADDAMYACGGGTSASSAMYRYDPEANSWSAQTTMPGSRYEHAFSG